ncbi:MAG: threonine synthase [Elusimicrobiota bacterium]
MSKYLGVIERYAKYLPVTQKTPVITLYEGNTPLLRAKEIEKLCGIPSIRVFLKCEGFNPTGSFKDRGMTLAMSKAAEDGATAVLCASTGNTAASAAAYAARSGIKCIVIIPEGAIALGKLSQAMIHGAKVIAIRGNFDDALKIARRICDENSVTLVNSVNPFRIEGQKTASFEIIDFLGKPPDFQFIPVGNAGNITAYWKGYKEYCGDNPKPKMMGFQAAGAAPIVTGKPVKNPQTVASAIRIGNPASWGQAVKAKDESGGVIDTVTDKEIISAYKTIASKEGIFVEPASAASVAGLLKYVRKGIFRKIENEKINVVCILTGHGLKDPDRAIKSIVTPKVVECDYKKVLKALKL